MRQYFWLHQTDLTHAPLTAEMIDNAEKELGVKLPASYIELLKVQNGGYLRYRSYSLSIETKCNGHHISIQEIFGIGTKKLSPNYPYKPIAIREEEVSWMEENERPNFRPSILDNEYFVQEWDVAKGLVLLDGDGHTWVALDYRNCDASSEPSVVWIDLECDEEIQLAANFQLFVENLVDNNVDGA